MAVWSLYMYFDIFLPKVIMLLMVCLASRVIVDIIIMNPRFKVIFVITVVTWTLITIATMII